MKIVCDACGAKYSIADEKVAGKVFKIRCKKCSNIIVVRGNAEQAAAAPEEPQPNKDTKVFDYAGYDSPQDAMAGEEGEWHLVIDQEQVGPMTSAEVRQRFAAGDVDADSYIWKEGFADWERIPEVPDFADLGGGDAAAAAVAAAAEVPAEVSDGGGLFGGDLGDGGGSNDLFGGGESAEADAGADLFGDASAAAGNDLFGGGESVGENTGEIQMSSEAEAQLKGQRNENSVLFSLGNLAALASDSPKPAAASSSSVGPGISNTGGSEGSGLIDIRSMASVYLADKKQPGLGATPAGSADDLPVFSQSAFESASPVLLPTNDGPDKKLLYSLIGVIGALLIAAIILVVIVVKDDGADTESVAANNVTEEAALDTEESKDDLADPEAASADETTAADPEATKPTDPDATPVKTAVPVAPVESTTSRKPKSKDRNGKKPKSSTTSRKPVAADPKPTKTSGGGGCDEVTCLVDPGKACCRKFNTSSSSSSSSSSSKKNSKLPENLSKTDFKNGLAKVRGRAFACGDKHSGSGKVVVKIKIGGDGRVKSASGSGGSSGLRNCVTSVVKRAKFKKTQKGATVNYPFVFH